MFHTINSNSRTPHGRGYDYANDLSTTSDDLAYDMYDRRFKGTLIGIYLILLMVI